jgi:1-acyl-sn-glycerol-3-phosphate acyltransferase
MAMSLTHRIAVQVLGCFIRLALRLRYRIKVEGFEEIKSLKDHKPGILFLPNHPAEIDPIILMTILGPCFFPRSLIVEHFYYLKGFQMIMDLVRVVPIPTMAEKANRWKEKEVVKILERSARGRALYCISSRKAETYSLGAVRRGFFCT